MVLFTLSSIFKISGQLSEPTVILRFDGHAPRNIPNRPALAVLRSIPA